MSSPHVLLISTEVLLFTAGQIIAEEKQKEQQRVKSNAKKRKSGAKE
jgi:hypothetical protein